VGFRVSDLVPPVELLTPNPESALVMGHTNASSAEVDEKVLPARLLPLHRLRYFNRDRFSSDMNPDDSHSQVNPSELFESLNM